MYKSVINNIKKKYVIYKILIKRILTFNVH